MFGEGYGIMAINGGEEDQQDDSFGTSAFFEESLRLSTGKRPAKSSQR
jgi:hypothetical protein